MAIHEGENDCYVPVGREPGVGREPDGFINQDENDLAVGRCLRELLEDTKAVSSKNGVVEIIFASEGSADDFAELIDGAGETPNA